MASKWIALTLGRVTTRPVKDLFLGFIPYTRYHEEYVNCFDSHMFECKHNEIESLERVPSRTTKEGPQRPAFTVIRFTSGEKIIVKETIEEIKERTQKALMPPGAK